MSIPIADFGPLQQAIGLAETWKPQFAKCESEIASPEGKATIIRAQNCIRIGIALGELLPVTWQAIFQAFFGPSLMQFEPAEEFESLRQSTRGLFYTVREALDRVNRIAISLRDLTGQEPPGVNRLTSLIDEARTLEETVFRDWPSFTEPPLEGKTYSVEESLAEALGISVDAARQKMESRRSRLNARSE